MVISAEASSEEDSAPACSGVEPLTEKLQAMGQVQADMAAKAMKGRTQAKGLAPGLANAILNPKYSPPKDFLICRQDAPDTDPDPLGTAPSQDNERTGNKQVKWTENYGIWEKQPEELDSDTRFRPCYLVTIVATRLRAFRRL